MPVICAQGHVASLQGRNNVYPILVTTIIEVMAHCQKMTVPVKFKKNMLNYTHPGVHIMHNSLYKGNPYVF